MSTFAENTPILITIFNRPDKVRALMTALAEIRPTRLFVAADGPRAHVPTDAARCAEARAVATAVSWPCEVRTNFSDANLGVDPAMERAITWFFENVEEGIILEDDCVPHPDFFRFSAFLLARYRNDARVMMVSGNNFQNSRRRGEASYYFSRYPNTWGWATWRRAWKLYDTKLSALPAFIASGAAARIRPHGKEQRQWLSHFESLRNGTRTPWDAKWVFALWNNNGLSITPNVNLVQNIGFGADSTHTAKAERDMDQKASPIDNPLVHPNRIEADDAADAYLFKTIYEATLARRIRYAWQSRVMPRLKKFFARS